MRGRNCGREYELAQNNIYWGFFSPIVSRFCREFYYFDYLHLYLSSNNKLRMSSVNLPADTAHFSSFKSCSLLTLYLVRSSNFLNIVGVSCFRLKFCIVLFLWVWSLNGIVLHLFYIECMNFFAVDWCTKSKTLQRKFKGNFFSRV